MTCTDCVVEFQTFFGSAIQGLWVTWKNTAADTTGTIDVNTLLEVDFDLRLYGVGLDTAYNPANTATPAYAGASGAWKMSYYLQFMNPYPTRVTGNAAGGNSASYGDILYDAVVVDVEM